MIVLCVETKLTILQTYNILSVLQLFPHSRAHSYPNLQFLQLSCSFFPLRNTSFPQATIFATVVQISISRGDVRVVFFPQIKRFLSLIWHLALSCWMPS